MKAEEFKNNKHASLKLGVYADRDNIAGERLIEKIGLRDLKMFEELIGKRAGSVMWYPTWDIPGSASNFPLEAVKLVDSHGAIPHLVWELMTPGGDPQNSEVKLDDVLNGMYDSYLQKYAHDVKSWGKEIFIRPLHEFNGTWYSWSGFKNGKSAEKTVTTWKYIVDAFRNEGALNAKWLWSPNGIGGGTPDSETWNHIKHYWPGEDYVDWIAMDAYNFYPEFDGPQPLMSFENCFREVYDQSCELTQNIPVMVAEFGSGEYKAETFPHNKSEWIYNAFEALANDFPRIDSIVWFDVKKEREWNIDSSKESLKAFRECVDKYI